MRSHPSPRGARSQAAPRPAGWRHGERVAWAAALLVAVAPLFAARALPLVDLPQHLYAFDVLARLHDPATLYARYFAPRPGLTPYLGYEALVRLLATVVPLEAANRIVVALVVAALAPALAFLLRSLGRPAWPALLAIPLAYGDSFGWGFVNNLAALPLTLLALGLFVRTIEDPRGRPLRAVLLAVALLAVLAFHPLPFAFLAPALPLLLATTPAPEDASPGLSGRAGARLPALAALLPVGALGAAWLMGQLRQPHAIAPGAPAAAALLAPGRLEFQGLGQNLHDFPWLLANLLQDGSDRLGLDAALLVAVAAIVAWLLGSRAPSRREPPATRLRPLLLAALAFTLYLALPTQVHGYIYGVNPRFAALAGVLVCGLVPPLGPRATRVFLVLALAIAPLTAWPLVRGFRAFAAEESALESLAPAAGERPVIMGLVYDPYSRIVHHPVYVHAAAVIARRRGGIPNYTFAAESQTPIRYRARPPAPLAWEWQPQLFDYARQGPDYDHFLLRGVDPARVFGARLGRELVVAAHAGDFWLVRRRPVAAAAR